MSHRGNGVRGNWIWNRTCGVLVVTVRSAADTRWSISPALTHLPSPNPVRRKSCSALIEKRGVWVKLLWQPYRRAFVCQARN